jgi:hypothetical protein
MRMRTLSLLVLAMLVAAPAALAGPGAPRPSADGTLSLRNATGTFTFAGRGSIIGQLDKGQVVVFDRQPGNVDPIVTGWERVRGDVPGGRARYNGDDLNFRSLGGGCRITVSGSGVDLSFVGRGTITLVGTGPGTVSFDGGDTYQPLPKTATTFSFPV